MRDVAKAVDVGKSSVPIILRTFEGFGSSSLKSLIRNSKINPRKISADLQRDFLDVEVSTSTVWKRLPKVSLKATRLWRKQFLTRIMMKNVQHEPKNIDHGLNDGKKVVFRGEAFFCAGIQMNTLMLVTRIDVETLLPDHIEQSVKHPFKQIWGGLIAKGTGSLAPL
ncbi:hypothetical protein TNCV_4552641 [Trichonephila clavipes]|nr:hypothetical protein TNCV_4552641 [Trichonephila clavipes]